MSKATIMQEALKLPLGEQLELAQALWENASPEPSFELSPELRQHLRTRRAEALANPDEGLTWEEVKADVLADSI